MIASFLDLGQVQNHVQFATIGMQRALCKMRPPSPWTHAKHNEQLLKYFILRSVQFIIRFTYVKISLKKTL